MSELKKPSLFSIAVELGPAFLLGVAWTVIPALAGLTLLFELGPVTEWFRSLGGWGIVVYAAVFIVTSGLGLLPTYAQAVLGGWIFGLAGGLPAAMVGFTGGSLLGYIVARCAARDRVEKMIERHKKASIIREALVGRSFAKTIGIITLLRIPPNSPFALTNLLLSSCRVPLSAYVIGVVLGMLPRTAIVVGFAAAAASQAAASGQGDIQSFIDQGPGPVVFIAGLALLIGIFLLLSHIANKALQRAAGA